jgi:hypothetical protein
LDEAAAEFLNHVTDSCRASAKESVHVRGNLYYDGLPWRGELWLTETIRLGPPLKQDESALLGPRVVVVDARIDAIDRLDATSISTVLLRELSVFLTTVMRTLVRATPLANRAWTWSVKDGGGVECEPRQIGYWESEREPDMPTKGRDRVIPLDSVERPDLSIRAITAGDSEECLPADTIALWEAFVGLSAVKRQQFLEVASIWQLALSIGHEFETTRFALMVAACEALKPRAPEFRDHNIYHVTEALLGSEVAEVLQAQRFRPQDVRNVHLHSGELRGREFVGPYLPSFHDPTFDQATRTLAQITPAAIIEWLRRGGTVSLPALPRVRSWRGWLKHHSALLLPAVFTLGLLLGMILAGQIRR